MATKKKTTKKKKDTVYLELDGAVYITEVKNGKKSSTPIEGELVLKILLKALEDGIKSQLTQLEKPKKVKKKK